MKQFMVLLSCVAYVTCSGRDGGHSSGYVKEYKSYSKQVYQGTFNGYCGADGFYYNDGSSFVMCSNGNSYVQPCAPGSRNSNANRYNSGDAYSYTDFCDVNLVDYGYTLYHGNNGYGNQGYGSSHGKTPSYGIGNSYGVGQGRHGSYGYQGYNGNNIGYGNDNKKNQYGYEKKYVSYYGNDNGYGNNKKQGYGYYKVEYRGKNQH